VSVEKRNFKERKSLCVAILPLKSGKIVVAVAWLFLYCCHIFRLSPLCSSRQTASRLAIKIRNKLKFCGRCPHPQPLKRLTKLLIR